MGILSSVRRAFPVSAVWFGALVGPSMASGAFAAVYFAPYGTWGLVLPLLVMGVACLIVGFGVDGARQLGTYEYAAYAEKLYGRFARFLGPLLEFYIVLAMVVGGSAVISMSGSFLQSLLRIPELVGCALMALICSLLVLWGAGLVRKASIFMTVVMVAGIVALVTIAVRDSADELTCLLRDWSLPGGASLGAGAFGAVLLGLSNASNGITLCSVSQNLRSLRDCVCVGVISFLLNSACFIACTVLILPYCPQALAEEIPNLYVIHTFLVGRVPWLPAVYSVVMVFGLISSGVPQLHAVASRALHLYPTGFLKDSMMGRNAITSVVYMGLCTLVSLLGLRTIIVAGYGMLGHLALPLIVLPVCVILPLRQLKK